jgi:hypothetical protein
MSMPTLLDIAIQNGSDTVAGFIDEATKWRHEVVPGYARTIKSVMHKTLVRSASQ